MTNTINVDKDILLSTIVTAMGGGDIDWQEKEITLNRAFLGKFEYNCNELLIKAIHQGRNHLYRGDVVFQGGRNDRH